MKLPEKTNYWWDVQISNRFGDYIEGYHKIAIDKSIEMLSPIKGKRVLDFGCGSGNWSLYLNKYKFKTTGIDIDKEAIRIYSERIPSSKAILISANSVHLPLENETIDLIIVISLSQMFNTDWFLKEAKRVLKTNGIILGTLQNRASWRGILQKLKSSVLKSQNPFQISFKEFLRNSKSEGFEIVFSKGFGWIPIFSRQNNSFLIPIFGFLEKLFLLGYISSFSPNIIFILRRN